MAHFRMLGVAALALATAGCGGGSEPSGPPQVAAGAPVPAADLPRTDRVENPQYLRWAKFKPGTVVTFREVSQDGENRTETTTTYTLKEVTDTYAAVETGGPRKWPDGRVFDNDSQELKHYRWQTVPAGQPKPPDPNRPMGAYADGEEAVTAAGRVVTAKWYKVKGRVDAGETITQAWFSDLVPGGLVKSVYTVPAAKKTVTGDLVEIKDP